MIDSNVFEQFIYDWVLKPELELRTEHHILPP